MATFDGEIRYAKELPPAVGPNVVGRAPPSTGLEYYAAAIGNLADVFGEMKDAWQDTQFSAMKREHDDLSNKALNIFSQTGDETARQNILKEWSGLGQQIADKYPKQMRNRFRLYLNEVEPQWAQNFAEQELAKRKRDILAEFDIGYVKALSNNDIPGAIKQVDVVDAKGLIPPTKAKQMREEAPNTAVLMAMEKAAEEGNYGIASTWATKLENPTAEQLKRKNLALSRAKLIGDDVIEIQREKDRDVISKALQNNTLTYTMIDSTSLDEKEQFVWSERLRAEAERQAKGVDIITDERIRSRLIETITEVRNDRMTKQAAIAGFDQARYTDKTIDDTTYRYLRDELDKTEAEAADEKGDIEKAEAAMKGILMPFDPILKQWIGGETEWTAYSLALMQYHARRKTAAAQKKPFDMDESLITAVKIAKMFKLISPENMPALLRVAEKKPYLRTAIKPETGERMGTYDGKVWEKIP